MLVLDEAFRISVHDKLVNVMRQGKLFDQVLMNVVKIISCIEETVGEAADQAVGVVKIARERVAARARRNVAIEVFVLCKQLLNLAAGEDGTLRIGFRRGFVISRNMRPEAGSVTEKGGILTKGEKVV